MILTWASDTEISKNMTKNIIQPCDPPNGGSLLGLSFIVHDIFPSSFFATQFFFLFPKFVITQFLGWKLFLSWAQVWCGNMVVWRALNSPDGPRSEKLQNSLESCAPSTTNLAGAKRVMEFQVKTRPNTTSWGSTPKNFGQEPRQTGWPRSSDP